MKGYSVGHWPIPESFWPDLNSASLPPRTAHPVVRFSCTPCDPMAIDNLPFDKYEMEPSPLTQYILERRQPNMVWQVYISNSAKYNELGHPFGYIKASSNLAQVNLFVMPYNYPVLLPLIDELYKVHKMKPTPKWRQQFDGYLKTMPVYYSTPLKKALGRMSALVPDQMDNCLSYSVVSYLKKLKNQAKLEYDKLVGSVGHKPFQAESIKVVTKSKQSFLERSDFNQLLQNYGKDMATLKQEVGSYTSLTLATKDSIVQPQTYKNAFDIPRNILLAQVNRMRTNFLKLRTAASHKHLHNMSVQDMGNYQEYLKKMPAPLREIETAPARQHTFGNPFKVNKNLMIDETDEAMPGQSSNRKRMADTPPSSPRTNKRKPGPVPRDVSARCLLSPVPQQMLSPAYSHDVKSSDEDSDVEGPPLLIDAEFEETVEPQNGIDIEEHSIPLMKMSNKKAQIHNQKIKEQVVREVKRPGKNYSLIFNQLNGVQGSLEMRRSLVQGVRQEALRFKRRLLEKMLEEFEQSMIAAEPVLRNNNVQKAIAR
ncbi:hypothetical protein CAPTEDRAFT_170208 [Capitella teleta]|uniref:Uncharacterized protein n=1 Tax=Capitella teleta TaxID=283909 RepID=R7V847_CAPTE|nr:hypothetical protein CAPTEDRAFT_170208 [Capitella teleta]|eukprot:ELU15043.1 hypothetical protein CAPTEDRAFT_170208 [Capitella teleta]